MTIGLVCICGWFSFHCFVFKYRDETWAIGILSPAYCYCVAVINLLFRWVTSRGSRLWCRVGGKGSWQKQTFHITPPRGRGEKRACSNSTFIKTYWRKTCWSMAGGGENQRDGWIQPPSRYLKACDSKLHFIIMTQPTHLISLPSSILSCPSSRPHSLNLLFLHFLSYGLTIYVHPPHVSPSELQDPQILLSGNSMMLLPHCLSCPVFSWCPAALGKGCVPGWIPGCVVLISPEWPLYRYWG